MPKLLDYIRWRGDLSFEVEPFNSVDAALFAHLIYLPYDSSVGGHKIGEASKRLLFKRTKPYQLNKMDTTELELMPLSDRYRKMEILDWTDYMQKKPAVQFTAATTRLNKNTIIVAFRGTDGSMIGLNEDVDMSYQPQIVGQSIAADYLKSVAKKYPHDFIYTVGHSKGGNLAAYAASALPIADQDRIIKAFSFDGPGFMRSTYSSPSFQRVLPKLITYVPEESIFGMMLDHPERTLVVRSNAKMLKQHDPRRWRVARNGFVLAPGLTNSSRIIRHSFISWNTQIPREKRESLWLALFSALENEKITEFNQLTANKLRGAIQFSHAYLSLDPEVRLVANEIISDIAATAREHINIPFVNKAKILEPLGNDSSKGPIVDDSYDGS
ncbi:Mbeg1-like protein [uncultured Lactobacillus sp.]|uniref:Mbeg1-like protein n=1 Tax=uncultured Lactobacillus sp. TaxID=153152 RepID=UPI00260B4D1D|nr:Mbeg1-like protein [uncultured Lactobacillus sp.]